MTPPLPRRGDTALQLAAWYAASIPGLTAMHLLTYEPSPGLRDRLARTSPGDPRHRARQALRHRPDPRPTAVAPSAMTVPALASRLRRMPPHRALALCSHVVVRGRRRHIAMVDLQGRAHPSKERFIIEAMREAGLRRGALLVTGRSYHAYGLDLLTDEEWRRFLARCLLLPVVDSRHVAHRLLEGRSNLRISTSALKPELPRIRAVW